MRDYLVVITFRMLKDRRLIISAPDLVTVSKKLTIPFLKKFLSPKEFSEMEELSIETKD